MINWFVIYTLHGARQLACIHQDAAFWKKTMSANPQETLKKKHLPTFQKKNQQLFNHLPGISNTTINFSPCVSATQAALRQRTHVLHLTARRIAQVRLAAVAPNQGGVQAGSAVLHSGGTGTVTIWDKQNLDGYVMNKHCIVNSCNICTTTIILKLE